MKTLYRILFMVGLVLALGGLGAVAPSVASDHLPSPEEPSARGLTVAGPHRDYLGDMEYTEFEVGDPVHDPGSPGYGNRTSEAVLRNGPVYTTLSGVPGAFYEGTGWVTWTKEPARDTPEVPGSPLVWNVSLAGSADGQEVDLRGVWVSEVRSTSCEGPPDDGCRHEAVGAITLQGTIGLDSVRLTGEARDAFCTEGGASGPGQLLGNPQASTHVPCGE